MDKAVFVLFFQDFSGVKEVFSVEVKFHQQSEEPMDGKYYLYIQPDCLSCLELTTDFSMFKA